ncbi:hypothetical protein EON80_07640 [bacterium]|nr:MAG: hypothetical protein EON80_07640 [bacterium]
MGYSQWSCHSNVGGTLLANSPHRICIRWKILGQSRCERKVVAVAVELSPQPSLHPVKSNALSLFRKRALLASEGSRLERLFMASGRIHAACSVALAAVSLGVVSGATGDFKTGLACATGCLFGIMMTPDLDQEGLSRSENNIIKWTMGLGFLWLMLWYPYARLIKHRSPLSHFPILGTAGRLLYLFIVAAVPAYFGYRLKAPPDSFWPFFGWGIVGLTLSDIGHYVFDLKWPHSRRRHRSLFS